MERKRRGRCEWRGKGEGDERRRLEELHMRFPPQSRKAVLQSSYGVSIWTLLSLGSLLSLISLRDERKEREREL